jgi:hypothetical protein
MKTYGSEQNDKFDKYNILMDYYIDTIEKLLDTSYSLGILPFKVILGLSFIKKYISDNRFDVLENGINYLLTNKDTVLNFDISNLDELDEDFDDNISIKSYIHKIKEKQQDDSLKNSDDMINLIIEIKNNTKKLCQEDITLIKKHFELLIIILEQIKSLF